MESRLLKSISKSFTAVVRTAFSILARIFFFRISMRLHLPFINRRQSTYHLVINLMKICALFLTVDYYARTSLLEPMSTSRLVLKRLFMGWCWFTWFLFYWLWFYFHFPSNIGWRWNSPTQIRNRILLFNLWRVFQKILRKKSLRLWSWNTSIFIHRAFARVISSWILRLHKITPSLTSIGEYTIWIVWLCIASFVQFLLPSLFGSFCLILCPFKKSIPSRFWIFRRIAWRLIHFQVKHLHSHWSDKFFDLLLLLIIKRRLTVRILFHFSKGRIVERGYCR